MNNEEYNEEYNEEQNVCDYCGEVIENHNDFCNNECKLAYKEYELNKFWKAEDDLFYDIGFDSNSDIDFIITEILEEESDFDISSYLDSD